MKLSDSTLLTSVNLSVWCLQRTDRQLAAEIARLHGADVAQIGGSRYILPPSCLDHIKRVASRIREAHAEITLPWLDDGIRILPSSLYIRHTEMMRQLRAEWDRAVDDFLAEYPRLRQEAQRALNGLYRPSEYPLDPTSKFGFRVSYRPLPDSDDFRVRIADGERSVLRQQLEAELQEARGLMLTDIARRIAEVCGRMAERLRAYQVREDGTIQSPFRDSLVANVRDLCQLVPALNVTGDPTISAVCAEMAADLTYDPDVLRTDQELRVRTADKAEQIQKRMEAYGI